MRIRLLGHQPLDTRARVCLLRGKAPGDPPMCGALSTCSYFTLGERWAPLPALSHNMLAQHTSQFLFQKSRTPRGAVRGQGSRSAVRAASADRLRLARGGEQRPATCPSGPRAEAATAFLGTLPCASPERFDLIKMI